MRIPPVPVLVLLILTVACSVFTAIDPQVYPQLALVPYKVGKGEVWRLVTWAFVELSLGSLVVACVAFYMFASELSSEWGAARFARYVLSIVVIAGLGTTLVAYAIPKARYLGFGAGWALDDAIIIAWAVTFPERQINYYNVLELGGRPLVYGTVGLTVGLAVWVGFVAMLPELFACAAALLLTGGAWQRLARDGGAEAISPHG